MVAQEVMAAHEAMSHGVPALSTFMDMHSSMLLASADALADPSSVVEAVGVKAASATPEVAAVFDKGDWFDPIEQVTENAIIMIHTMLGKGSYGLAIIFFTLFVKVATFPLNYAQIESTTKMQQLQPAVKRIQARYANDPQQMNLMLAELYQENDLNPLAGCLPALAQIPIFIALYRALFKMAKDDLLQESFLWLPNLEGPVFGKQNSDWLLKFDDWNGLSPPLGWHDTLCYLSLPLILIVAQSISSKLLQPPQDPNNEQAAASNAVLKFLPILIGFFSLNVPCSLALYWIVNNIFTTTATVLIKRSVATGVTMGGEGVIDVTAEPPKPKRNDPASFDDLLTSAASMKKTTKRTPAAAKQEKNLTQEFASDVTITTSEDDDDDDKELSKTAEKKKEAAKSRRKKSRRRS